VVPRPAHAIAGHAREPWPIRAARMFRILPPALPGLPASNRGAIAPQGPADQRASIEPLAIVRQDTRTRAIDSGNSEQRSVASRELAVVIATPTLGSADAPAQVPATDAPPPAPALKPLALITSAVVETIVASDALAGDGPLRLTALTLDPPTPSLKPIAEFSSARSGLLSSPHDDPAPGKVARGKNSLPDALRALWSNLKILAASSPASRVGAVRNRGGEGGSQGSSGATVASAGAGSAGATGGASADTSNSSANGGGITRGGGADGSSGGPTAGGSASGSSDASNGGAGAPSGGRTGGHSASWGGANGHQQCWRWWRPRRSRRQWRGAERQGSRLGHSRGLGGSGFGDGGGFGRGGDRGKHGGRGGRWRAGSPRWLRSGATRLNLTIDQAFVER
jgi:hypothetical protein